MVDYVMGCCDFNKVNINVQHFHMSNLFRVYLLDRHFIVFLSIIYQKSTSYQQYIKKVQYSLKKISSKTFSIIKIIYTML